MSTPEDDARKFDTDPITAYDNLLIPPVIQQGGMVQKQVILRPDGKPTEYDTCMTCGALLYPDKVSAHQMWHNAIRDTFQSQKNTNQSMSVAISVAAAVLGSVRNLVRPLVFPPAPQEPRSLKRRPRPKKGKPDVRNP
jgi:hypothetical protein